MDSRDRAGPFGVLISTASMVTYPAALCRCPVDDYVRRQAAQAPTGGSHNACRLRSLKGCITQCPGSALSMCGARTFITKIGREKSCGANLLAECYPECMHPKAGVPLTDYKRVGGSAVSGSIG